MNESVHPLAGALEPVFDLVVTDIEYVIDRAPNPRWRIRDFVNSRSAILAYAISGRAHYQIDGAAYEIEAGDIIFMPRGTPHTAASDSAQPWRFLSVAFTVTAADGSDPADALQELASVTPVTHGDAARLFHAMVSTWATKRPGHLLQIRGAVALVLHRIVSEHDVPDTRQPYLRRMGRITEQIVQNYERTYSVEELAALADLSPSHFRTVFKQATGMTATRYQQQVKIAKATEFLASGEYNVTETARACGFRDVYYFSHLYKKLTGSSPSEVARW
ncbi:AraC family transcriptional regulator [Microbacterium sp. DT81.1]|uniref:helix-turn-helix transcriptional regulator n=1 Tax=Microbacterium sp. DT81.1 TaxID=3393413 RepID=UPI003CF63006